MKKIFPIMLMGLMICLTPAAFADPVQLTGDVLVKYEKDTASGSPDVSGTMSTIRLKATTELGDGWSLYARLGAQHATEPELADYNTAAYRDGKKSVIGLDQFGLTYTRDHMVYKIGRQDATVGTTALLYSRSDSNVGKHYFVDGISAAGKVGAMDISALFAQEDNAGSDNNRIYAIRTGYSPRDDFNFGLTLGRYHYDGGENTNHWAVDGTRSFGKHSLTAEYAKSNSSNENKAYAATWNYNCDAKTALY
ncbi:MAG: porin, partial [Veillonellales bacterium]